MNLRRHVIKRDLLKPFKIPDGFTLIVDTREQQPLFVRPPNNLNILKKSLKDGDYSIEGYENVFCIERKKIGDFYSYIGRDRRKTTKKMHRFSDMYWVGLAIEAAEEDILSGHVMSKVPPEVARQTIASFELRYRIHVYFNRSRHDLARWILDRAIMFHKIMQEDQSCNMTSWKKI